MKRILASKFPPELPSAAALEAAWTDTDRFLADLPGMFSTSPISFCSILGQRNLSGFIGEVFKSSLHNHASWLEPNPHPDGRPDLLDLRTTEALRHYVEVCHHQETHLPLKEHLSPFKFGGVEVKVCVGNVASAANFPVGTSRVSKVRSLSYWAHHRHACNLLALYYDHVESLQGLPEIKALFFARIEKNHWAPVSTGKSTGKKTSNTQILKPGMDLLKSGLLGYDSGDDYVAMLQRLRVPV